MENRAPYDYNRVTALQPVDCDMPDMSRKCKESVVAFLAPNPNAGGYRQKKYTAAVEVRLYWSMNGQTAYALLWGRSRDGETHVRGHGRAGGYGYHKISAAADEAFDRAGVTLERHFGGCGDSSIEHAVRALAKRLGWKTGDVMSF